MGFHWPERLPVRVSGVRYTLSLTSENTVDESMSLCGMASRLQGMANGRHPVQAGEDVLAGASRTDLVRLMLWQFSHLQREVGAAPLPLGIRVQASLPVMHLCLQTTELMTGLKAARGALALETTGPLGKTGLQMVSRLSEVCPVWLGGFGAGDASLVTALTGRFSGVVVHPQLLAAALSGSDGVNLFRSLTVFLSARGRRVVVRDVKSRGAFSALKGCGVDGFQGSILRVADTGICCDGESCPADDDGICARGGCPDR